MIAVEHRRPDILRTNAGFTLLEIIAVLVILSILAVVAVPRYFDLQASAQEKAIATALAEGMGRVNGHFAKALLEGSRPEDIYYDSGTLGADLGDFTLTSSAGAGSTSGTGFDITVTGKAGTPLAGISTTAHVAKPGRL